MRESLRRGGEHFSGTRYPLEARRTDRHRRSTNQKKNHLGRGGEGNHPKKEENSQGNQEDKTAVSGRKREKKRNPGLRLPEKDSSTYPNPLFHKVEGKRDKVGTDCDDLPTSGGPDTRSGGGRKKGGNETRSEGGRELSSGGQLFLISKSGGPPKS